MKLPTSHGRAWFLTRAELSEGSKTQPAAKGYQGRSIVRREAIVRFGMRQSDFFVSPQGVEVPMWKIFFSAATVAALVTSQAAAQAQEQGAKPAATSSTSGVSQQLEQHAAACLLIGNQEE